MPAFDVPANLAFDSYEALVDAINDWLDRSDLTGTAQQMIALCEARLRRELTPMFAEVSASVICTAGFGSLPADCSRVIRVIADDRALPQFGVAPATQVASGPFAKGYTLEAGGIRVWPATNATLMVLYQPKLVSLSDAAPNNELLDSHPDVYFFGSLMFAEGYLANDNRALLFKNLWDEAIAECKRYMTRQHFAGQLVPRGLYRP
jgi:hypothetical protein